jgi:hypothetical protein
MASIFLVEHVTYELELSILRNVPAPTCAFLYEYDRLPNKISHFENIALQITSVLSLPAIGNKPFLYLLVCLWLCTHQGDTCTQLPRQFWTITADYSAAVDSAEQDFVQT